MVVAVDDEAVGPPVPVGARGGQELSEGRGEAVQGLEEEPKLVVGDVVGRLGAVGEPLDSRERQRHELDARRRGGAQRREAGNGARRGDERHAVAPRRQPLGELQAREQVAEREPREDHDAQRPRAWGPGFHDHDGARRELVSQGPGVQEEGCLCLLAGMVWRGGRNVEFKWMFGSPTNAATPQIFKQHQAAVFRCQKSLAKNITSHIWTHAYA